MSLWKVYWYNIQILMQVERELVDQDFFFRLQSGLLEILLTHQDHQVDSCFVLYFILIRGFLYVNTYFDESWFKIPIKVFC